MQVSDRRVHLFFSVFAKLYVGDGRLSALVYFGLIFNRLDVQQSYRLCILPFFSLAKLCLCVFFMLNIFSFYCVDFCKSR